MADDVWIRIGWIAYNSILSLLAVGLGYLLKLLAEREGMNKLLQRGLLTLVLLLWLFVLPNTCYLLLAEWRQFIANTAANSLYVKWILNGDISIFMEIVRLNLVFLIFSLMGAAAFSLSIRPVFQLIDKRISSWLVMPPFFFIVASLVYFGLRQRFDYWGTLPAGLNVSLHEMISACAQPVKIALFVGFAIILWLVYLAVDIWIDGYQLRRSRSVIPGLR
jgi:hypothetical protein